MQGSKILQVVSILMIIFGAIGTVVSLIGLLGVAVLVALGVSPFLYVVYLLLVGSSIAELVIGIIGVINCKNVEKAQMLIICGAIVAALTLLGNIMAIALGSANYFSLFSGLVIPVLFIVGAVQLKKGV